MSRRPDERSQSVYQQRGSDIASARRERGSSVSSWSIRTRLLISIGAMLVTIIAAMIWVGYREVSVSASDLARERLRNLTQQFASISQQAVATGLNRSSNVANDPAIRAFIKAPSNENKGAATHVLEEQLAVAQDPASVQVELWKADRSLALTFPENASPVDRDLSSDFARCTFEPFRTVGLLREFRGTLVGNLTAAVRDDNGTPIGFLVRWRRISITPGPAQLRALLGDDASLYFGNANREGWTDLTNVIPKPQFAQNADAIEYNRDSRTRMAMSRSIEGTPWAIAIEISTHALAGVTRAFLRRATFISVLVLFVGMVAAFLMARGMTRPLVSLTHAASAIADGDYSQKVAIDRRDELGTLANAFNAMTAKVSNSQRELERKVKERTAQLEAAAGAILMIDRSGIIRSANQKAEALFGCGEGDLTGKSIEQLVPERYRGGHESLRQGFFAHPEARPMGVGRELFGLRRDGSEVPIEIGLNPIHTDEGVFVLANIIDITERRRAEEQFRVVVEASPNAILMVNSEGRITLVNNQTEKLFGYTRGELIGQRMEMLTPERYRREHPQLRSSFFLHPSTRAMGAGRDLYGRRKDGTEVPIEIGLNPINTSDGMYVLASIINISERKRREEQLHLQSTALEFAANAIMITDVNGKIAWVNKAFTETTGYSAEEVVGENPRILKSDQLDASFYKQMWETILSGNVWRDTVINRRKDGSLNREDMTITPISDGAGKISHFVAIKQDITKLEQAISDVRAKNEELATMTQQLWQASRLATMGELAASVAHELNNPLATISLRLETLAAQLENDDQKRRSVEIVADEAERMGKLVGNLLQFSRRTHRQISTIDAREELDNSVELIEYHLRSNNVKIVREYDANLPTIQADRQQLRQVFLNLMTNASDAMKSGGTITLRATVINGRNAEMVRLEFEDTGGGINPENLQKIWDPFFTTKPEGKGTGLGLAICKRVIEEHHGSITIQSEGEKGTRVTLEMPTTNSGSNEVLTEVQDV